MRRELHGLTVRPLAPADYAGWSAMRQQLWPEDGRDDAAELARMHVPCAVLVGEREGALVGFAEATSWPSRDVARLRGRFRRR